MTSKHDVANALVEFALLATADPTVVPDRVRLAGDTKSPDEIGRVVEQQTGQRVIVASIMSAGDYKKSIDPESPDLPSHLRSVPFFSVSIAPGSPKPDNYFHQIYQCLLSIGLLQGE